MSSGIIRKAIAAAALIVIAGAIFGAGFSDRMSKPMRPNGDVVGQRLGESYSSYQARAAGTIHTDGICFALVTLAQPMPIDEVGALVDSWSIQRVSEVVYMHQKPVELPEPMPGRSRSDVLREQLDSEEPISGFVVYDDAIDISALAGSQVGAIEMLPNDAAWGRFGIRTVKTD